MKARLCIGFVAGAAVIGSSALAADPVVYKGTFKDVDGRLGPLQCTLTQGEGGKWTADFKAENKGKGPQRPLACQGELTGTEEAGQLKLAGEITPSSRLGAFTVHAQLKGDALTATFKKAAGGNDGTFELARAQAAPAAPAAPAE